VRTNPKNLKIQKIQVFQIFQTFPLLRAGAIKLSERR